MWKKPDTRLARLSFFMVKSVVVVLSAFLWLICSGQIMFLLVMVKGVHCALKVSKIYTSARDPNFDWCVGIGSKQDVSLPEMPTLLSDTALFLPHGFVQCLLHLSNRRSRGQQQYYLNFECLLHAFALAIKAFHSPYRAQLTHDCNAGLLWTLSP